MSVVIWHNPRCSKSRQTLELVREKAGEPEIMEYLKTPPTAEALRAVLDQLGLEPRELMRKKEPEYKEHNLADPALTREQLIAAMVAFPRLIERPIVLSGGKAALGRPPEKALDIL